MYVPRIPADPSAVSGEARSVGVRGSIKGGEILDGLEAISWSWGASHESVTSARGLDRNAGYPPIGVTAMPGRRAETAGPSTRTTVASLTSGGRRPSSEDFPEPYLGLDADFLEIGPGYGRWTEFMVGRTRSLTLVDLNANCIEVCRDRFASSGSVSFVANDGRSLPVPDGSTDVVWSFGSFVHFDTREIAAYLGECARVLRVGGRFVIHHAGWPEWSLTTLPVTKHMGRSGRVLQHRISQGRWRPGGDRTPMSAHWFASLASANGLRVDEQVRTWGEGDEYGLAFNDVISIGTNVPHGPNGAAG